MKMKSSDLKRALDTSISIYASKIGENDKLFIKRNFSEGLKKYKDRLAAINFRGHSRVLDAGCGYGQWALALSQLNSEVSACDISNQRIDFLSELVSQLRVENIIPRVGELNTLPYPDKYFDAVFCYGAIFVTPWRESLAELGRVLRPGGRLYLSANGVGWYLFLWEEEHNKTADYDPKSIAAKSFLDTLTYDRERRYRKGMQLMINPEEMKNNLYELKFEQVEVASEGSLHVNQDSAPPKPFFRGLYKNQLSVFEVTAVKANDLS